MHIHRVWLRAESFVPSLSSIRTKMTGLCVTKTLVHISISSLFAPSAFLTFFFPSLLYHPFVVTCILLIFFLCLLFFSLPVILFLHWRWHLCLFPACFSPQCRQFWILSKTQPYTVSFLLLRPSRPVEKRFFSCCYQKHLFPWSTDLMKPDFLWFRLWLTRGDSLASRFCFVSDVTSLPAGEGRALPRARSAACCPHGAAAEQSPEQPGFLLHLSLLEN